MRYLGLATHGVFRGFIDYSDHIIDFFHHEIKSVLIFRIISYKVSKITKAAFIAFAIDCYVCTSINWSDPYCEDAFNTSYDGVNYLQQNCMGYRKDRTGYFPADHCIKIAGASSKSWVYANVGIL